MKSLKFEPHIRRESRGEVRKIAAEYQIDDSAGISLLMAYANADTIQRNAQGILEAEGMVVEDRFAQKKPHPMLGVIRDALAKKMAALKMLNLDLEPLRDAPGRPGGRR